MFWRKTYGCWRKNRYSVEKDRSAVKQIGVPSKKNRVTVIDYAENRFAYTSPVGGSAGSRPWQAGAAVARARRAGAGARARVPGPAPGTGPWSNVAVKRCQKSGVLPNLNDLANYK